MSTLLDPWMVFAKADVGVREIAGALDNNPKIVAYYAAVGHPEIKEDEVAWCAAFVGACLKRCGYPLPPKDTALLARSYLTYGKALDEPQEGCIVVLKRGNSSWQGHVGFVVRIADKTIRVLGGNQSNSVSIQTFKRSEVLGYRWPVKADPKELKDAGSSEIAMADKIKTGAAVGTAVTTVATTVSKTGAVDNIKSLAEPIDSIKPIVEGADVIVKTLTGNLWLLALAACVGCFFVARWWIAKRVKRHEMGQPITGEG